MNKNIFNVKVALIATLTSLSLGCKTFNKNNAKADDLKAIDLIVSYPVTLANNGEISFFNLKDTISIIFHDDLILYKLLARRKEESEKKISGSESYFIYKKNSGDGYLFNNLSDGSKGTKMSVDSFLNQRAFANATFDTSSLKLVEKKDSNKIVIEKYIPLTSDENTFDSIYYYYSPHFKNIHYSFSRNLDSIKGMKLYEVRILYEGKFSNKYNLPLPKREFLFKIEELQVSNFQEILHFFDTKRKFLN
jgi:hypothetical protein